MTATLDDQMETASQALAELDYARCESLCVKALGQARDQSDWVMYQRVLLPLQEARRQKRQAALDGPILLGTPERKGDTEDYFAEIESGCIVLTWPYTAGDAAALDRFVRDKQRPIEVLYADNEPGDTNWQVTSFAQPALRVELPAPKADWIGNWTDPIATAPPTPAHWFMQASEALGNAALAAIDATVGTPEHLQSLEAALSAVDDHEILHQRLADAAQALHEAKR